MRCSQPKISRYFSLLSLPAPVFTALREGRINTVHALLLKDSAGLFGAEYLDDLIGEIAEKNLSSRELERRIKSAQAGKKQRTPREQAYFHRTKQGFKLTGFSYHRDMAPEEKQKAVQALKEALTLLEAELKGGAGQ